MTKYILNSGNITSYPEKIQPYVDELSKGFDGSINLLWCFFATEPGRHEEKYDKYTKIFEPYFNEQPIHTMATQENFIDQVTNADVITLQGGNSQRLKDALDRYDLPSLLKDKVVAGHSAGANNLCTQFWSPGQRDFNTGYGLVTAKFLSHMNSDFGLDDPRGPIDWGAAYKELEAYGDTSLPIHALEEGDFVVYYE